MSKHTILAVNDAPDQLELLVFILGEAGYNVLSAENGVEGLVTARRELPDLIISNVALPEMDGVEFCRQIRADKQLCLTPFLLVSALRKDTESVVEGFTAGADDYIESPFEPLRLAAKVTQLVERKRMEDALHEGENHFRLISRATNDALWDKDFVKNTVWYSDGFYKLFGLSPDSGEADNDLWFESIHPDGKERVSNYMRAVFEKKENYCSAEYRLRSADGSYSYINDRVYIIYGDDGKPARMTGAATDITERKLAEQVLQASRARLEKQNAVFNELTKRRKLFHVSVQTAIREVTKIAAEVLETARVGVWLYEDDKSKIKALNVYDLSLNSHSEGIELLQTDYPTYFEALANDEAIICNEVQTDARTREFTESYLKPLGITAMLDVPIRFGGQVVGVVCHEHIGDAREWKLDEQNFAASMAGLVSLLLEANERRQAEKALRASQEHLALAQQAGKIGSFELNLKTGAAIASSEMKLLYGVPSVNGDNKLESWGEDWSKFVHPDDAAEAERNLAEALQSGVLDSEYRIIRGDGVTRWIYATGKIFYDDDGAPTRVVGVNTDITDRKEAEIALRASREYLEIAQKAAKIGSFEFDFNTKIATSSASLESLYGMPPGSLTGGDEIWSKYIHPEDFPRVRQEVTQATPDDQFKSEFRVLLDDGKVRWMVSKGRIFYDAEGKPARLVGINIDITERKEAETILRFQKTLLEAQSEASIDGVLVVAPNDEIISYNQRFAEMWEIPENVLAAKSDKRLMQAVIDKLTEPEKFIENINYLHQHPHVKDQVEITLKDGRTFEWYTAPVTDGDDTYFGRIRSFRDITKRKRIEEVQRESREKYESLVNAVDGIVWEVDAETFRFTFVSKQAEQILGYPIEQWTEPDFWVNHLHPEDRLWAVDFCVRASERLENHEFDYRLIAADGRVVWLRDYVTVDSKEGKPVRLRGVMVDITERKVAEDSLRESEERYRLMFDSNPLPMWVYSIETLRFLAVNDAAIFHYGYSREEFLSMTIKDIRPPEDVPALLQNVSQVKRGIDAADFWRHRKKNGDIIDVEITSHELLFAGESAKLVMAVDVTERKQAESSIRESEKRYRLVAESASDIIITIDEDSSIIFINPAVEKILGYKPEELVVKCWKPAVIRLSKQKTESKRFPFAGRNPVK